MDEIHTLREKAEIDEIAAAFQNGFTNGNAAWEETPEYHKDMFREGTRCALALLASRTSNEVLVKPLEWDGNNAFCVGPSYHVWWYENGKCWLARENTRGIGDGFETAEDAKAAAQSDYASRIRSALSVGRGEEG